MSESPILQSLQQAWIHSHEEDSPGQTVYRPAGYSFPASRGRTGFDLLPGQQMRNTGIAASDGPVQDEGYWQLKQEGDSNVLKLSLPEQPTKLLHIISATSDRLVVKS